VNLPNRITLARFFVGVGMFSVLALLPEDPDARADWAMVGLVLFVVATASDFLDGYLARHLKQVTAFGRMADPFVDKVIVCGTLILLCALEETRHHVPAWAVVVIVTREFLVTAIRGMVEALGRQFPADRLGKLKMVLQSVAAGAFVGTVAGIGWAADVGTWTLWPALALTVISGLSYLWKARDVLFT
jgi:CDP-diacylglycerol--glycerol-3-phosphate 3-phosphatidyltransferase